MRRPGATWRWWSACSTRGRGARPGRTRGWRRGDGGARVQLDGGEIGGGDGDLPLRGGRGAAGLCGGEQADRSHGVCGGGGGAEPAGVLPAARAGGVRGADRPVYGRVDGALR